uniref:RNA-directed DNA polymerase, eukaryota, reverse transcriptase zinc-binding domain protein n=1 Tax=Tanacetum cinerariifolium TaxID=118510 RepID=A0A6L2JFL3_TANCI|nr:RNA-directed DNA polymerase, eukaryota, reverse transcriptase zinc-binding domain protein [Tanacetum cinerariifolium]
MIDFMPGRAVFDVAQRKRDKFMAKCAAIGYGFLPFSFSSLGKLEACAVTLPKQIRKFFMAQDIGARVVHIFNRISFAIAKGVFWVRAKEVPGWIPELLEDSDEEVQSDDGFMEGDNKVQYVGSSGDNSEVAEVPETNFNESIGPKDQGLKYPLGFTPNAEENDRNVNGDKSQKCNKEDVFAGRDGDSTNRGSKGDASESTPNAEENDRNVNGNKSQKCNTEEGNYAFDYIHSNSVGNSGGILCAWDPNSFRKSNYTISDSFVIIQGVWLKNGIDLLIVAVYTYHYLRDKRMLWDYLVHTINQWDGEVVIMGDFKEVQHKYDRFGSIFNGQGADEFNSFIANLGLEEVPLGGSAFTWCHKSATKMSNLDRFLISENLFITCPHIIATTLERHSRTGMKQKYKEELRTLDDDIDTGNGSDIVVHKRMEVINTLQRIHKLNAMEIAQKTMIKWSVEGDENSRFFHGMLNKKWNQLNIRGVIVDGVWNEKPHDVKREFFQHFSNRFDKPMEHRAVVDMCYPRSLLIDQQEDLERMVTKEEVKRAMWDCGTDKSPGPDGFTFGFYRQFWLTIENDVFEAVSHFFMHADIPKGCNPSFIALISKIPDANKVNDFRPISLIGSIYKIIAKILANRLVRVLGDIINEVQSAFIAERKILDGQFILNEVLQWCKIKKKQSLIFKVDFEKAYDSVRRDFLDDVLKSSVLGINGRVVDAGLFMGIKLSHLVNLSHMFYADDAVFVGQWSDSSKVGRSMSQVKAWKEVIDKNGKSVNVCTKLSNPSMDYSFRRKTKGGAGQEQLDALMDLVSTVNLMSMGDRWVWTLESSGEFSVASLRKVIDEKRLLSVCSKTRWVKFVPIKVNVLAWKIKMDVLPTRLNISRRGIDIHSISCPICDCGVESLELLFFRCNLTRQIARKISL